MRTNLRPVALAIDWPSDVLPTPGGPTRQRIGAFSRSTRCCTAQVLDDALLDLLEAVVIGVEHLDRGREVLADLALLAPRQREQRVDVVAHDRRFGRHRRHHLQLLQLGHRLASASFDMLRGLDLLFHLVEVGVLVALAELLLDRLHLLVQVVLALALLHLPLDAAADALLDLQDVDLAFEEAEQVLEPLCPRRSSRGFPAFARASAAGARRSRRPAGRHRRCPTSTSGSRRDLLVELDVLVELREQRAPHRLDLVRRPRHRRRWACASADRYSPFVHDAADARALRRLRRAL